MGRFGWVWNEDGKDWTGWERLDGFGTKRGRLEWIGVAPACPFLHLCWLLRCWLRWLRGCGRWLWLRGCCRLDRSCWLRLRGQVAKGSVTSCGHSRPSPPRNSRLVLRSLVRSRAEALGVRAIPMHSSAIAVMMLGLVRPSATSH